MKRPSYDTLKAMWEEDAHDGLLTEGALDTASSTFLDAFYATRFVTLMSKPFKDWDAFAAGVIDDKGEVLVKTGNRTRDQRRTFTHFHRLVWNLKKLLNKFAPGRVASVIAATKLIMESELPEHVQPTVIFAMDRYLLKESYITADQMGEIYRERHGGKSMKEDAPANSTAGIAGPQFPLFKDRLNKRRSGPIRRRFEDLDEG